MVAEARISTETQAEILRALEAGEPYVQIAARHMLNPVTVGAIGKAHGFKSARGQQSAVARTGIVLKQTEKEFQSTVVKAAGVLGFSVYHTWLSKHSAAGFPDLVLVRPPRIIIVELKSETGKLTPAQQTWGELLGACDGVSYFVWRPSDWPEIESTLQ